MLIRRETPADVDAIRSVTAAAFARPGEGEPFEARLVDLLRAHDSWLPPLSRVAVDGAGRVVGHVLCTRATVDGTAVLGLGPLSVHPDRQRAGVGSALVYSVLGAADALGATLVGVLGDPAYYRRFGFVPSGVHGIVPQVPDWAPHFQVLGLAADTPRGTFRYPEPFFAEG